MRSAVSRSVPPSLAIFLGLTNPRSADILSASGHSPLGFAEELLCKVCALRAGGQDVRAPGTCSKDGNPEDTAGTIEVIYLISTVERSHSHYLSSFRLSSENRFWKGGHMNLLINRPI